MSKVKYRFCKPNIFTLEHFSTLLSIQRKQKSITQKDLSERLGISKNTLLRMLKGDPRVAIGHYFEAAIVLGVPLFDPEPSRLAFTKKNTAYTESLLPKRVKAQKKVIDDDF